ncbi:hypothetical protein B0T26DRAFT_753708 [Lasiosphaeria miniovina]|uniref:CorA-like transporter domain-containing protein n=1 Tax=Lasiosphaeria miniovina TaxID=1954250 RepID=A0AA40DS80_9PEZI|nr:uncharacterized protein B0T26DRAFT_753708 [Lasiosphaeria miniovina]KAK0713615.1 hypothetical protein B0T26DRAFT_753708 [Lasiosphaeria miniovina]
MLALLFSYHQVMPDYLDFLASFGFQSTARDVRHSAFRRQMSLKQSAVVLTGNGLGRSGHQYQVAYNLKGVTQKGEEVWSIRNAAFYHQYDVGTNRALWIVTKGGTDIYESYKELTGSDGRPEDKTFTSAEDCFAASLSPHLLFCRWSTEDWRGYIRVLEEKVDKESKMAVIGLREHGHHAKRYRPSDIQLMQALEEKASEAAVVLEGNVDIMTSLRQFYEGLAKDDRFPCRNSCAGELTDFVNQLDAMIGDLKNNSGRARALVKTTADRKELIIQYRGEESAERMHRLNKNMEEETIVVRIITLVTLIYLPATFVSTFFSTDIIKYQDDQYPNGRFSNTAMYRWLQVTLPLTFLTLLAAWVGKMYASKKADEAILDGGIEVPPLVERLQVGYWLQRVQSRWKWPVRQSPAMPLLPLSKRTTQAQPVNGVTGQQLP